MVSPSIVVWKEVWEADNEQPQPYSKKFGLSAHYEYSSHLTPLAFHHLSPLPKPKEPNFITMRETELVPLSDLQKEEDDSEEIDDYWEEESQHIVERQSEWTESRDQDTATGGLRPWKVGLTLALIVVLLQLFFLFGADENKQENATTVAPTMAPVPSNPQQTLAPTVSPTEKPK